MFRQEEEGQVHHHPRGLQEDPGMSATQGRSPCAGGANFKFWCHKHFKIETMYINQC